MIGDQDDFLPGTSNVDSLSTNVSLDQKISVCINEWFKASEDVHGLFKELN